MGVYLPRRPVEGTELCIPLAGYGLAPAPNARDPVVRWKAPFHFRLQLDFLVRRGDTCVLPTCEPR